MTKIIVVLGIGFVLGLINAAAGTAYGLSKSNRIGTEEGTASDFAGEGRGVVFHRTSSRKK